MKVIMVMYDSLNRHMLNAYGCNWTHTPNFDRWVDQSAILSLHIDADAYRFTFSYR